MSVTKQCGENSFKLFDQILIDGSHCKAQCHFPYGAAVSIPGFHRGVQAVFGGVGTFSRLSANVHYAAVYSCTAATQFKLHINSFHSVHSINLISKQELFRYLLKCYTRQLSMCPLKKARQTVAPNAEKFSQSKTILVHQWEKALFCMNPVLSY